MHSDSVQSSRLRGMMDKPRSGMQYSFERIHLHYWITGNRTVF